MRTTLRMLGVITVGVLVAAGCFGENRPDIDSWAPRSQRLFNWLGAIREPTAQQQCQHLVAVLEHAESTLLPSPTVSIDAAFGAYLESLLRLYRECPSNPQRARMLHDRANEHGRRAEQLVNAAIDVRNGERRG